MGKTLYISDLDGTLLGNDSQISDTSREILNSTISKGALFSVATARTPATVGTLTKGVLMNIPAVVMTGASLWHTDTGLYEETRFMAPGVADRILEIYRRNDFPTFIYTLRDDHLHIYHLGELSDNERAFMEERAHTPYKTFHIGEPVPKNLDNTMLVYTMQPTERSRSLYNQIRAVEGINPLFYHDIFGEEIAVLEAFSKEATKANAVRALARRCGADRIVAFGDNINDLTMLEVADVAVAVENAVEEVKQKADIIIGPNTADSVARFIAEDFAADNS